MEIEKIIAQKEKISLKKERLEKRGQMLKMRERKLLTKKLIEVGELFSKAEIEHLDPTALLGALLEIKEKAHDAALLKSWSEKGAAKLTKDRNENAQALILSFGAELPSEARASLKSLKFRWNPFRKEWCGFGKKEELESLFKEHVVKVELVSLG